MYTHIHTVRIRCSYRGQGYYGWTRRKNLLSRKYILVENNLKMCLYLIRVDLYVVIYLYIFRIY